MPTIFRKRKHIAPKEQPATAEISNKISFTQFAMPLLETIGREKEVFEIIEILKNYNFVMLTGKKYIGKTAIACAVAQKFTDEYDNVIYVNCVSWNEEELISSFCDLLSTVKGDVVTFDAMCDAFLEVAQNKKIFFVFDNVTQNNNFSDFLDKSLKLVNGNFQSKIIVIKSYSDNIRHIRKAYKWHFEVPGINESDVILLGKNESINISREQAAELVSKYNGCPAYIQIVLEYCKQFCESSISAFLELNKFSVGNIEILLKEQFEHLSNEEKDLLYFTMLLGDSASSDKLISYLNFEHNHFQKMFESLLDSNFLLESTNSSVRLALPLKELLEKTFEKVVCEELISQKPYFLVRYPLLMNLESEEIITYHRHMMRKIIATLQVDFDVSQNDICSTLFRCLQSSPLSLKSYLTGNIINLMTISNVNICDLNFSNRYICNANMEECELHNIDFTNAQFENCSFKNIFGSVTAVSYNKKYELVATAFFNGLIIVWDQYGCQITILMEFDNSVNDMIFFEDKLFACGKDGKIVEWEIDQNYNFEIIQEFCENNEPIRAIAYSKKHNRLFAGSEDGIVRYWNLNDNSAGKILCQKKYRIKSIVISPNGECIAIGGDSEEVSVFNINNGTLSMMYNIENRWVRCLDFYDNNTILCGGDMGNINILDISNKTCETILNVDKNKVWSIVSMPHLNLFVVGGNAGTIKIFDIHSKKLVYILQKHSSWVRCLAASDSYLYSGSEDQTICIWNLDNYKCQKVIRGYTKRIFSVDSDNSKLYAGLGDHSVIEIDKEQGTIRRLFDCSDQVWTLSVEDSIVCAGCDKGDIYVYDLKLERMLYTHHFDMGWIGFVKFSPDGNWLAVGDEFGTIYIFNVKNKYLITQTNKYKAHNGRVASAFFTDDSIVSVGEDGNVFGFNYKQKKSSFNFKVSEKLLYTVDKISDNKCLAGDSDGNVYLIDLVEQNSKVIISLKAPIWSIKLVNDNTFVVGTDNGELHQYTIEADLINKLNEHSNQLWTICIDETNAQIITGGEDSQIIIHDVTPQIAVSAKFVCNLPYDNVRLHNCTGLSNMQKNYLCTMGALE